MAQYINKAALITEIESERKFYLDKEEYDFGWNNALDKILSFINTLEVKEFQKKKLYVVTRCEEHSDYVEKVFFSEKKAEEYCKQFEGNEDAYGRDITEIEVDCTLEVKEVDLEKEIDKEIETRWRGEYLFTSKFRESARHFFELGLNAQKGE